MNLPEIHAFAIKWLEKFKDPQSRDPDILPYLGNDCNELGFPSDKGLSFTEKYGKDAFESAEYLQKIIDTVDDVNVLGSAIYGRWWIHTNLALTPGEIVMAKKRAWFITALNRLAALSEEDKSDQPEVDLPGIHVFALKWIPKFKDQNTEIKEFIGYMEHDCLALGFTSDLGESFTKEYGWKAIHDVDGLREILDNVDDIMLLGTGILSFFRGHTHWAYDAKEVLEPQNRAWLIAALERLADLSEEEDKGQPYIRGKLVKLRIDTNNIPYYFPPHPDDEVEQHLTIRSDGRVFFSSYVFGDGIKYKKNSARNFKTDPVKTQRILSAFEQYFSVHSPEQLIADTGTWQMKIENEDGEEFHLFGSVSSIVLDDGTDLSDFVRDELSMQNLFVLDGNEWDRIDRIKISYLREKENCPDYTETLILDRSTQNVTYEQCLGFDYAISRNFYLADDLSIFLDAMSAESLFTDMEGSAFKTSNDLINPGTYNITVNYKKKPEMTFSGSFDKDGLPKDFPAFMEALRDLLHDYEHADLFDSAIYGKVFPKNGELIFCSVAFEGNQKTYYYLTEDISLNVGDLVKVPVGSQNQIKTGKIEKIECFPPEDAPFPVEKIKKIESKLVDLSETFQKSSSMKKAHWKGFM